MSLDRDAHPEAGLSLLEVMVGLAIVALVATVAMASLIGRPFSAKTDRDTFVEFVASLQRQATMTAAALVLQIDEGHAEAAADRLKWNPAELSVRSSRDGRTSISVVLFPDGTVLGPDLLMSAAGTETKLGLVERHDP